MTKRKQFTLTPEKLAKMRSSKGLNLKAFWEPLGYGATRGYAYETGANRIPEHVIRLVYLSYVLGIPTDINTPEFAEFEAVLRNGNSVQLAKVRELLSAAGGAVASAMEELKND